MRKSKMLKLDKKLRPWLKYYGDVPANMEYPNFSMVDLIIEAAEKYPNNMAYSYYGSKVSYKEFIVRIKRCAKALKNYGVKEGDNVTICMPNTPEGITMVYAVNMIGAICNMVHPLSSEKELEFYINAANSKYILVIDAVFEKILKLKDKTNLKRIIIAIGYYMGGVYEKVLWTRNEESHRAGYWCLQGLYPDIYTFWIALVG